MIVQLLSTFNETRKKDLQMVTSNHTNRMNMLEVNLELSADKMSKSSSDTSLPTVTTVILSCPESLTLDTGRRSRGSTHCETARAAANWALLRSCPHPADAGARGPPLARTSRTNFGSRSRTWNRSLGVIGPCPGFLKKKNHK